MLPCTGVGVGRAQAAEAMTATGDSLLASVRTMMRLLWLESELSVASACRPTVLGSAVVILIIGEPPCFPRPDAGAGQPICGAMSLAPRTKVSVLRTPQVNFSRPSMKLPSSKVTSVTVEKVPKP